jgi:Tfp pilus assembly PilM family ATPase
LEPLILSAAKRLGIPAPALESLLLQPSSEGSVGEGALSAEVRGPVTEYLETVTSEVQRSLAYMAHRHLSWQFRTIGISGEGAALAGLRERLVAMLGVEVVTPEGVPAAHAVAAGASRFGSERMGRREAA